MTCHPPLTAAGTIDVIECHAEGEVGDVIVDGIAPPPGKTIWEQSRFIAADDSLRRFMLNEPRGGVFRHCNLLVPARHPDADIGFIIMEPADTPPMSGSNAICVSKVVLDTGIVQMQEPETRLTLEAPGGLVDVIAQCRNGKAESITIRNVASFACKLDASLDISGIGTLVVDTAFGGDSFVIVDAETLGFGPGARRGSRTRTSGCQDRERRDRTTRLSAPDARRMAAHLILPLYAPGRTPCGSADDTTCGRYSARQDRSIANRNRCFGPGSRYCTPAATYGLAIACWRNRSSTRSFWGCIEETLDLDGTAAIRPSVTGPRMDYRSPTTTGRQRRPLADRLSNQRHLASSGHRRRLAQQCNQVGGEQ